jgi:hypothetical protein
LVKELETRLRPGYKHDAPGNAGATIGYAHGPGGILSFPGVDPVAFHTIMGAQTILGQLPATPSLYTNPTYQTLTGVTDESGTEPDEVCDAGPIAGLLKSCLLTAPFGRYKRQTQEIDLDRIGQRVDRADPMDLTLVGSPLEDAGIFSGPGGVDPMPADLLTNEISKRFWERNVAIWRLLSRQLWVGTPNNNNVGGGYREFAGFETLVTTGHVDAQNNQSCPAIDSYVRSFGNVRIDVAPGAANIVAALTDMYYQVKDRATRTGVMPVRWVFAMRPQLFYELTAVWPCSYLTYRCQTQGNERVTIEGTAQTEFRDAMRTGRYLLIDGERIPVIVDDGISEDTDAENANVPAGCFGTDIFLIPMSVVGGRSVTFLEYFQYSNPAITDALGNMVLGRVEGAFITWPVQTRECFQWESKIEPRLVLRTPWLAARLEDVNYCPAQHVRDMFPDDPYFEDGGRTSRPGPSYYTAWASA